MYKKNNTIKLKGKDLITRVKDLVHKGNVTKIIVKDAQGERLVSLPATLVGVGVLLSPILAGLSAVLAISQDCTVELETKE